MWLESESFYQFWNVNLYQLQFVWIGKVLMADRYLLIHSQAYGKLIVIYNYHMGNFKKKIRELILLNSQYLFLLELCEIEIKIFAVGNLVSQTL